MTNGAAALDVQQFDMTVSGLRTAQVGPSEQHVIQFNVYSMLKHQYQVAGHQVTEAVLVDDAIRLKRDLQRLQGARPQPESLERGVRRWIRLLLRLE